MKWCIRSRSPGHRMSQGWTLSMHSLFLAVYHPIGWNGGSIGKSTGMSARKSPMMLWLMQNFSAKSVRAGCTFWATGLYFLATKVSACHLSLSVGKTGYNKVCGEVKRVCEELESVEDLGTLLLFSKLLAQLPFHYFFGLLWLQNFKQLFLTHFCTDSLDSLSKCVLLIIVEISIPLSKQYY